MSETMITNAKLILEDRVLFGAIVFDEDGIRDIGEGRSAVRSAIDAGGDYVCPGLIEMHTDNAERHFEPRPGVLWPDAIAAILTHDAQIAAAGITTVYDSICAGYATDGRRAIFPLAMRAVGDAQRAGIFRVDHKIHIRCELTGEDLIDLVEPFLDDPLVKLVSLMDHTPGQRQWRDLEAMKRFHMGLGRATLAEHQRNVAARLEKGPLGKARNLPILLDLVKSRNLPIASHDDTTPEDVEEALAFGAIISEFPTTLEAARAAHAHGLATVAGAPNIVRGGSHSSGISVATLIEAGVLDGLSSDYAPSSLLQAVTKITGGRDDLMPRAMAMATWRMADVLGLADRGHLRPRLRADIVRFGVFGSTPVVREVFRQGVRVH